MPDSLFGLNASDLPQVTRLPRLPQGSIAHLNISNTGISEVPGPLPRLQSLDCSSTPIQQLPALPSCFLLEPHDCWQLEQLPAQLSLCLKALDCSGCNALQQPPTQLPLGLESLNCTSCSALQQLPAQLPPQLRMLNVSQCTALLELPALPASLSSLDSDGCSSLQRVHELPVLQHLTLKGCVALRELCMGGMHLKLN
jgi:Leucine-rich repeat (LRR) protein